jgi:hypothetical protein
MKKLILIIAILFLASPVFAANRYFDATEGDDANTPCTNSGSPCQTLSEAESVCASGDTCYFQSEETWTDSTPPALTASTGVTYDGATWGAGTRATIQATGGYSGNVNGLVWISVGNVIFKGFEIDGNQQVTGGIYIAHPGAGSISNVEIDNCVVHDVGDPNNDQYLYGIIVGAKSTSAATTSDITINNNTVYNADHEGIGIYPSWNRPNQSISNVTVSNNTVYNAGLGGGYPALALNNDSDNITIEYNILYNSAFGIDIRNSSDDCGAVGSPNDFIIRYNAIYSNDIGINIRNACDQNMTGDFYGNLIFNSGNGTDYGFDVEISGDDNYQSGVFNFYNNTIYNTENNATELRYGFVIGPFSNAPSNLTVNLKNNIFYTDDFVAIYDRNTLIGTHNNNLIYRSDSHENVHVNIAGTTYDRDDTASDLTNWEATAQKEDPAVITTPVNSWDDLALQPTSPAKNNGADLGSPYDKGIDTDDTAWPPTMILQDDHSSWEIGAFIFRESEGVPYGGVIGIAGGGAGKIVGGGTGKIVGK